MGVSEFSREKFHLVGRKEYFYSFLRLNKHRSGQGTQCRPFPLLSRPRDRLDRLWLLIWPRAQLAPFTERGPVLDTWGPDLGRALLSVVTVTPPVGRGRPQSQEKESLLGTLLDAVVSPGS